MTEDAFDTPGLQLSQENGVTRAPSVQSCAAGPVSDTGIALTERSCAASR